MRPVYVSSKAKFEARLRNLEFYIQLKGNSRLPKHLGYWTLCNEQPETPGSEIVQMVGLEFIDKSQFVGVDRDKAVINHNKKRHPEATWIHGEWLQVIRSVTFNAGAIYLDTEATYKTQADLIANTMIFSPVGAVLFANVVDGHVYTGERYAADALRDSLNRLLPEEEIERWSPDIWSYTYRTNRNHMRTYVLYKEPVYAIA